MLACVGVERNYSHPPISFEADMRDSILFDKSFVGYFGRHFFTCRLNSETDFHPCL